MGPRVAMVLVFFSSAAVLVVELVALRLLAPYLGLTLETNTLVIGIALTAIAAGAWMGGRLADIGNLRRLPGPALGLSGAVVAVTPAAVRWAAEVASNGFLAVAIVCVLVPGAMGSTVTPIVTNLRLTDLGETGTIVGRLSGVGTPGAVVAAGGCDVETTYHCAVVVEDLDDPDGRLLVLDGVGHSYVDLADSTELNFGVAGGNLVAVASDAAIPTAEIDDRLAERSSTWRALEGEALQGWVGDAPVLTDDHAPVVQLLTPYADRSSDQPDDA